MNTDRTQLAENLRQHIRQANNLRKRYVHLHDIYHLHNVISILPGIERLSWKELDSLILRRYQFQPWSTRPAWTYWEYGILLRLWLLSSDGPLAISQNYIDHSFCTIEEALDILFNYHSRAMPKTQSSIHALPARIHANKALVAAVDEESAEKVKFLTDLTPDPAQTRRNAYGYALNQGKTEFFFELFKAFGIDGDLEARDTVCCSGGAPRHGAFKESLLHYWMEIVSARKINRYFGGNPSENGCWVFFLKLARTDPEYAQAVQDILAKSPLISESLAKDAIHAGIVRDIRLLPSEPNLAWFTFRNRARFFAEYAADFRAALAPGDPILGTVDMAERFMARERK